MKANSQPANSSTLLATATGIGSVGAAVFGIGGAIVGAILGFAVGYWGEIENRKSSQPYSQNQGKKAHT